MANFVNDIDTIVLDSLKGLCSAHQNIIALHESPTYVIRKQLNNKKVALVSGGGSGHEPLHAGFIGSGMLDAACPGQMLTSPTPDQIAAAITAVDTGNGVLAIVKNYQGDKMNFKLAINSLNSNIETVIVSDDSAFDNREQARGIAGTLVIEKIVGAAAERGKNLTELKTLAEQLNLQTHSIGVGLSALTMPMSDEPMYSLSSNKIEYGIGIHGEKGIKKIDYLPANKLARLMIEDLIKKLNTDNKNILLFVNGLGGTPLMELYIIYQTAAEQLTSKGFNITRSLVGNYVTSVNVNGCSITISNFDDECTQYWDDSVTTPYLKW